MLCKIKFFMGNPMIKAEFIEFFGTNINTNIK